MEEYKQRLEVEMMKAAQSGNVDNTRKALHQGIDVNARDKHDRTALMHAADNGHIKVVRELLRSGANPRLKEKYFGRTALMFAMRGELEIAKELLDSGAEFSCDAGRKAPTGL
jgi:ankyrin repeat protein